MPAATANEPLTVEEVSANLQSRYSDRMTRNGRAAKANQATSGKSAGNRHARDRWAAFNVFVDSTMRELSEAELRVWLILFRDVRDGLARAGMSDIARRAGMSRRGVVKAVAGLKRRHLIEVAVRGSVNGSTNAYRVFGAAPSEP